MKRSAAAPAPGPGGHGSNKEIRAKILAAWTKVGPEALAAHCGGMGLVVGCPVCGKIFGKFSPPKEKRT